MMGVTIMSGLRRVINGRQHSSCLNQRWILMFFEIWNFVQLASCIHDSKPWCFNDNGRQMREWPFWNRRSASRSPTKHEEYLCGRRENGLRTPSIWRQFEGSERLARSAYILTTVKQVWSFLVWKFLPSIYSQISLPSLWSFNNFVKDTKFKWTSDCQDGA